MSINIDKELSEYVEKKIKDSSDDTVGTSSDMLEILSNFNKTQRKLSLSNMSTMQQMEKMQRESEELYKSKIASLEKENLEYKREINSYKKGEDVFVKKIISIIDEVNRIKYYADNSGNEKLMKTLDNNLKFIKKQLADMNIEVIAALGEIFNDNYHDCIETKEDIEKENFEIAEEIKAGFSYKGKVVRASEVVVIKNK